MADYNGGPISEVIGDYVLGTIRHTFFNAGVRKAWIHTYHWMVLTVLRGEGAQQNGIYLRRRKCWPIKLRTVQLHTEGGRVFKACKG